MLRAGSIALIEAYQRRLSPLKGFACAHRVLHGGVSCSQAVKLAIAQGGLAEGCRAAKTRARDCRAAMVMLKNGVHDSEGAAEPERAERKRGARCMTNETFCLLGVAEGCDVCFLAIFS